MEMLRFVPILLFLAVVHGQYTTVYIEDFCKPKEKSVGTYRLLLPDSYNSTVILRPRRNNTYSLSMNCYVNLYPPVGYGVVAAVRSINFKSYSFCENFISLETPSSRMFCRNENHPDESRSISSEETMKLWYKTLDNGTGLVQDYSGFEIIFTTYATGADCDNPGVFQCQNERCVWSFLLCDGHNNCGDRSDESCELCGGCSYGETYLEDLCAANDEEWTSIEVEGSGMDSVGTLRPREGLNYTSPWDCLVNFEPPQGFGMTIIVDQIDFATTNCSDFLKIFVDTEDMKLCHRNQSLDKGFISNFSMQLEYKTRYAGVVWPLVGFQLIYAANALGDDCDIPGRFMCANKRCISSQLLCDGRNNCGDDSDESCEVCGKCGSWQIYLETRCSQNVRDNARIFVQKMTSGTIRPRSTSSYSSGMNCQTALVPPDGYGIILSVADIDFKFENCSDTLTIYNGTQSTRVCSKHDLSGSPNGFVSSGPIQLLYQTSNSSADNMGFSITYTVYLQNSSCTADDQFLCKNNICISSDLKCNGQNNCGDDSDEDCKLCGNCKGKSHEWKVIVGVVVAVIFIIFLIGLLFWLLQRRKSKTESSQRIIDPSQSESQGYGSVSQSPETTRAEESTNGYYERT